MLKSTILAAAVAMSGIPFFGFPTGASAAETEQVFTFYCAQCHGLEGKGDGPNVSKDFPVSPRNFTSAEEMNKLSDADLKNVILDGGPAVSKSAMMPPWSKTLSEAEVDGLIQHLRKLCACEGKKG
jgi:mono/diheme cytochrome c family protein